MKLLKGACIEPMYAEIPFLDRFQAAKDDGFDYVEFWSWTDKDLDAVKAAVEKAGIGISGFNGDADYSLVDPTHKEKYLEFLKKSVAAAQKIGAKSVTIHSNALGDGGIVVNHYDDLSDTVKLCSMYDMLLDCAKIAEHHHRPCRQFFEEHADGGGDHSPDWLSEAAHFVRCVPYAAQRRQDLRYHSRVHRYHRSHSYCRCTGAS